MGITKGLLDRIESLEARMAATAHQAVIIFRPGDDIAALIAATPYDPAFGHLVLPADVTDADEWERLSREHHVRKDQHWN